MEKNRDNTTFGDYQRSNVECDINLESSAQQSDVKYSTEQMIQTEQMLKEKEREVEVWEKKYTEIKEELTTLKGKMSTEFQNSFEVCLFTFITFT